MRSKYSRLTVMILLTNLSFMIYTSNAQEKEYDRQRREMVDDQLRDRGIRDERVLEAFLKVGRHHFVLEKYLNYAYEDGPLPIGCGQTISQPYIVAFMVETAEISAGERVLEIGTGSGYQAAILGELARSVYTIEIIKELGDRAAEVLQDLGYENVFVRVGDGYEGWPEYAPFDAILVAAAAAEIPQPLIDQLAEGGRMVIPVGNPAGMQYLMLLAKENGRLERKKLLPVRFVPFTRE